MRSSTPFRSIVGSCSRIASAIWSDTRITGSSEFMAPWKTIEIRAQRTCCMPRSVRLWIETTPSGELSTISPDAR